MRTTLATAALILLTALPVVAFAGNTPAESARWEDEDPTSSPLRNTIYGLRQFSGKLKDVQSYKVGKKGTFCGLEMPASTTEWKRFYAEADPWGAPAETKTARYRPASENEAEFARVCAGSKAAAYRP